LFALVAVLFAPNASAQVPLAIEITPEHPLFLFRVDSPAGAAPGATAQFVLDVWAQLPENLRPFAALVIAAPPERDENLLFQPLQEQGVPLAVSIPGGGLAGRYSATHLETLLDTYTTIKGVEARGIYFDRYDAADDSGDLTRAQGQWLIATAEAVSKYGRFFHVPMQGLDAARFLSNPAYRPVIQRFAELAPYVIAGARQRGADVLAGNAGAMGFWFEGIAAQWGICADSNWYTDARCIAPGLYGRSADAKAPTSLYRAMLLNGAMAGACVYAFDHSPDLWFGAVSAYWNEGIHTALTEILDLGLIARREFVEKHTAVAFQVAPASNPRDFRRNTHELSAERAAGVLWQAAYGLDPRGMTPELILNRGDIFWIPLLSPHASAETQGRFRLVLQADPAATVEQRAQVLADFRAPVGESSAFVTQVGRGLFILNHRENEQEAQGYALPEAPAPVRGLQARREGPGVVLSWPFREGDVSYKVYRRVSPQLRFTPLTQGIEERTYTDLEAPADQNVAYAVTALTSEMEPLQGVVNFGDYLALSIVESRIAEEAMLTPLLASADAQPSAGFSAPPLDAAPLTDGLDEGQRAIATALEARLATLAQALARRDVSAADDLYGVDYEDPQGWRKQYVKRAFQWFAQRTVQAHFRYQVRRWDFTAFEAGGAVSVVVYCELRGATISDASGRDGGLMLQLPRHESGEVLFTWTGSDGIWRIQRTEPAFPNFGELLAYSAGPFDDFSLGPDNRSGL